MNSETNQVVMGEKARRITQAFNDLRAGQVEQARTVFADLMHDPQHGVDAYRGLASVAWHHKQAQTAVQLLKAAVEQQPDHADAQADLALLLFLTGHAAESLMHWDKRLRLSPRDALAWHNYGKALVSVGHIDTAASAFEQALEIAPELEKTYEVYARALAEAGAEDRSEAIWRRGIEKFPKLESMYLRLAELQFNRSRLPECLETYRSGVAALPDSPDLHMGMGQILDDLGDKPVAEAEFRRALQLRPGWAMPVEALLTLLRKSAPDDDLEAARRILEDGTRPPADHANVGYGLGKALDARGDYDGAFEVWNQANAARRKQIGMFDRDAMAKRVDRYIAQFSKTFIQARKGWGHDSRRPVFVLGMPRSGTTLVEQILSAHPDVYGYGELTDLGRVTKFLQKRAATIQRWPEAAGILSRELIRAGAEDYLASLLKRHPTSAAKLVDKAPNNFSHIGLIALLFPNAVIVWCRRDPRDICTSIYSENFGLTQKHATDLADIAFFYRQHMRLMRHWLDVAGDQIYQCSYEDLIAEPEAQSRRLVEAVGLPWDDNCLRFHEGDRPVLTPSRWQVRQPLYGSSVGRWKRYEKWLGPLLKALEEPDTVNS